MESSERPTRTVMHTVCEHARKSTLLEPGGDERVEIVAGAFAEEEELALSTRLIFVNEHREESDKAAIGMNG